MCGPPSEQRSCSVRKASTRLQRDPVPNEYHRVRILALHQLIGHYWAVDCHPQQLFGSAVAYYAQYRPGYPRDLADALAARAGLDGTQRVLDIGCGTGQITIPLARHAQAVMAIDPIPGMLAGWGYGEQFPGQVSSPLRHGDS